ncbi:hypothetical protein PGB90_003348 [Kerria lacca]
MFPKFGQRFISSPDCFYITILNKTKRCRSDEKVESRRYDKYKIQSKEIPYNLLTKKEKLNEDSVIHPLEFRDLSFMKSDFLRHPKYIPKFLNTQDFFNKNTVIRDKTNSLLLKIKCEDQSYNSERVDILGPDLSAAHFFMCRGAGVKFVSDNNFIRCKRNRSSDVLPNTKDDSYKIEAIDASKMDLMYEALENLSNLKYLRWLSFENCQNFDNWYLDYLSKIAPNIEYLDLSYTKIDHHALNCIYRLKNLKYINVEGIGYSELFSLTCLTIEAENPKLVILGLVLRKKPKSVFDS